MPSPPRGMGHRESTGNMGHRGSQTFFRQLLQAKALLCILATELLRLSLLIYF